MAGIKSDNEMAELASSDPASWVAEQQRQRQIGNYLQGLDQKIQQEKAQAQQQAAQASQQALAGQYEKSWGELSKAGIDKPKLEKIYADTTKHYGFNSDELANVYDHRLVNLMKDATAFRELQSKRKEVLPVYQVVLALR